MDASQAARGSPVIEAVRRPKRSLPWYLEAVVRLLQEKPLGTFGGAIVVLLILVAVFASVIAPYAYDKIDPEAVLKAPSTKYWFGTDTSGRDVFSRLVYGARLSLYAGFGAIGFGLMVASILGTVSAYFGGKFDMVLQRFIDAWMAFPGFILLLTLMGILGPDLKNLIIVLALGVIPGNSRVIRGQVLSVKESQYIEAARAIGCGHVRIIFIHIMPQLVALIIIIASIGLGGVILAESSLSFLGFGVPPPAPSWGGMLSGVGRMYLYTAPWLAIFPGIFISLAVFGFNLLGDGLRDVLDPRLRGNR